MNCLKPGLTALMLALSLVSARVRAQESPAAAPAAREPAARPAAEQEVQPAQPPKRKPIKRRSVQQVIEPTPRIVTEGAATGGGPTLEVRPPAAVPAPVPGPARMNSCDAGGCFDANGARFNGGAGTTLIGPQGQLCTKGPVNAQCF